MSLVYHLERDSWLGYLLHDMVTRTRLGFIPH